MTTARSDRLFDQARQLLPGGVNSPVRAFRAVGNTPRFVQRASGAYLWDVDGNRLIDYVGSWGPMILGHAHPRIIRALRKVDKHGTSFGAPTEREVRMAELICAMVPSIEMVRMVNSGTEATLSAIRLARAFTKKDAIIKFEGCYHGHGDSFLIKAGSGALTLGVPDSPGVPESLARHTLTARYNDLESVRSCIASAPGGVAAIIVEPVVGNMGCVPPKPGFLEGLREICTREKILLIFDEVMTGFRLSAGGAQQKFGITPDLTTLGKIIGGGLPVGAYGGKKEIMSLVAPAGPMYQAGTLSGNPLAMAAGYELLRMLSASKSVYAQLEKASAWLEREMTDEIAKRSIPARINRVGSMFTLFFTRTEVVDYDTAKTSDTAMFGKYFSAMLERQVYLPPSQFEAAFLSAAHTESEFERTVKAHRAALALL